MIITRGLREASTGTRVVLAVLLTIAAVTGMYWGFQVLGPFLAG